MLQNVKDDLAITKSELEKEKNFKTDITETNLRLTNYDVRLRRNIENRDRHFSAVNLKKIEPKVNCATKTAINDGISTKSEDELTLQSFLRLMAKVLA